MAWWRDGSFRLLARSDVGVGADHAQRPSVCIALDNHAAAQNPFPTAILALHAVFIVVARRAPGEMILTVHAHPHQVFGVGAPV